MQLALVSGQQNKRLSMSLSDRLELPFTGDVSSGVARPESGLTTELIMLSTVVN